MAWIFEVPVVRGDRFVAHQLGMAGQTGFWDTEQVPGEYQATVATYIVEGVRIRLQTSALAGARRPVLRWLRGAQVIASFPASSTVAANLDQSFIWADQPIVTTLVTVSREAMPAVPLILTAVGTYALDVMVNTVQVGDVLSEMMLWGRLEPRGQ